MRMYSVPPTPKPLTGRTVFVLLVAFFGCSVIGVNLVMMKLAIQTLPGTEVEAPIARAWRMRGRSSLPTIRTRATGRSTRMFSAAPMATPTLQVGGA